MDPTEPLLAADHKVNDASMTTGGRRQDELRLYMQNAYLVPGFFTFNPIFWGCRKQYERAARIGAVARAHDVSALCEVWGSGSKV